MHFSCTKEQEDELVARLHIKVLRDNGKVKGSNSLIDIYVIVFIVH